jgi:hypothetical protein
MKYLKKFNEEYTRTVGFRYSEPKIEMTMAGAYSGNLTKDLIKLALDEFEIKVGNIHISNQSGYLEDFKADGMFNIDFFVYNERKDDMDSLVGDVGDFLSSKGVQIVVIDLFKK